MKDHPVMLCLWRIAYYVCLKLGYVNACWHMFWNCKYGDCRALSLFTGLLPVFRKGIH